MKNSATRIILGTIAVLTLCAIVLSLGGCSKKEDPRKNNTPESPYIYDRYGNTTPKPTDNDETGWFSVEVLNKYAVAALSLPEGTEVYKKTAPETLYLEGDEKAFTTTAMYVHSAIEFSNGTLYSPVISQLDDGTAAVTGLEKNALLDTKTLYPEGDITSVTFVYLVNRTIYQANISLEKDAEGVELVYLSFSDKTEEYKDFI